MNYNHYIAHEHRDAVDGILKKLKNQRSHVSHMNHKFLIARGPYWETLKQLEKDNLESEYYVDRFRVVIGEAEKENVAIYDDGVIDVQDIELSEYDYIVIKELSQLLKRIRVEQSEQHQMHKNDKTGGFKYE